MRNSGVWALWVVLVGIASCTDDPLAQQESEIAQIFEDSVNQSDDDIGLIESYLSQSRFNGLTVNVADNGLHYLVLDEGDGDRFPEVNDIVSMHFIAFTVDDDSIFDTSIKDLAIEIDSSRYASNGISLGNVMAALDLNIEGALSELNASNDALGHPVFNSVRDFDALHYNHTEDGSEIRVAPTIFGFNNPFNVPGFEDGLSLVTPNMREGGRALILLPSAIGYGVFGAEGGRVAADEVIAYEFQFDKLRP